MGNRPKTKAGVMAAAIECYSLREKVEQLEKSRRQVRLERARQAYTARYTDPSQGVNQETYEQMLAAAGLVR